jgi:hypothetical protein
MSLPNKKRSSLPALQLEPVPTLRRTVSSPQPPIKTAVAVEVVAPLPRYPVPTTTSKFVYSVLEDGKTSYYYMDTDEEADPATPGLYMQNYKGKYVTLNDRPLRPPSTPLGKPEPDPLTEAEAEVANILIKIMEKIPMYSEADVMTGITGNVLDPFTTADLFMLKHCYGIYEEWLNPDMEEIGACELNLFVHEFMVQLRRLNVIPSADSLVDAPSWHEYQATLTCAPQSLDRISFKLSEILKPDSDQAAWLVDLASMRPKTENMAVMCISALIVLLTATRQYNHIDVFRERIEDLVYKEDPEP